MLRNSYQEWMLITGLGIETVSATETKIIMENSQLSKGYLWVCRTIDTCNNILQLETAERLIENFRRRTDDRRLFEKINWKFTQKAKELHYFDYKSGGEKLVIN